MNTGQRSASSVPVLLGVLAATAVVVAGPAAASVALRVSGLISSSWLSTALAVALSCVLSSAASLWWRKYRGAGDLLFSELLLWGWLRRRRHERKLDRAITALGLERSHTRPVAESVTVSRAGDLLRQLVVAFESQDVYLRGHSRRVARYAAIIAQVMGLPSEEVDRVRTAAVIHDVGKFKTPRELLHKPSRLTDREFELIRLHPADGAELAAALVDPRLTAIVRHHHERVDGAGYPDGLRGEEIPLGARIIAVADTFDAITSTRPYRGAARHKRAVEILRRESGSQLDSAAVRAFLAYYSGNRQAVVWAIACATLRRSIGWLNGESAIAAPISSNKLAATVLVAAAIGGTAAVAPIAIVNASGLLHAAHGFSAQPDNAAGGSRMARGQPRVEATHQGRSRAADRVAAVARHDAHRKRAAHLARGPRPVGIHTDRQTTSRGGTSPSTSTSTLLTLLAATSLPAELPAAPIRMRGPSSQGSSTPTTATVPNAGAITPPRRPSQSQVTGHTDPKTSGLTRSPNHSVTRSDRARVTPTNPNGNANGPGNGSPDNAYGQGNGPPGNVDGQSNGPPGYAYGQSNGNPGNARAKVERVRLTSR